ncbi:amidase [Rhodococcus fascians]|uniref:amidase n=1 Tax=Rhodococcus sp. 06-1474-1B TaxID=2022499 RepID=UPI000B9BD501|nr:amidase [Rhodococcus sp. 06-1474-1B]MBY4208730.1 amidase [Rhodococcus fascians]OZD46927.1 glutamyl-tRNA amidotransferase [Rhodococcus sp. 06-1474-1B]OZD52433.1 glutamyl-tRNA amidotransferase [Rhodococcus sp. 06-1477-1B]
MTADGARREFDPLTASIADIHRGVESEVLDPVGVVDAYLDRIGEVDDDLEAFVVVNEAQARAVAERQRDAIRRGELGGPLRGVPVAVKDLYDVEGIPTRSGSLASSDVPAQRDSETVARLRAAGAIVLGKTTTHEYAYGVNTPPTRNPWALDRVPGGSSGGSGAAVAARLVPAAMGTDTGGSIRIPAALCGVTGLKATYGRVSKRGVTVLSWTLDHAGPLTTTVADCASMLDVLAGHDPGDPYSAAVEVPDFTVQLDRGVGGLRLGVSERYFTDRLDPDVAAAFENAVRALEAAGATIVPVSFDGVELCPDIVGVIASVEAASVHQARANERPDLFGSDVIDALRVGHLHSGVAYVDAQRARAVVLDGMHRMFGSVDALLSPTIATTAPPFGASRMALAGKDIDILNGLNALTVPANVTGMPALTVPAGFDSAGLPIGLQIMTPPFEEALALAVGNSYQSLTDSAAAVPVVPSREPSRERVEP